MTSKERMLISLDMGVPDRTPITIHQWQPYHLRKVMGGMHQLEAFRAVGLDASIETGAFLAPVSSGQWAHRSDPTDMTGETEHSDEVYTRHVAETPDGVLTWATASNPTTTFITEHPVKNEQDAEIFVKHFPGKRYDAKAVSDLYDRTGDSGIVRGFITSFGQCGPWQDF